MSGEGDYWVYMLLCSNGHLYTGSTPDLTARYRKHLAGKGGARYTRSFPPLRLAACWKIPGGRGAALRVEAFIKRCTRSDKLLLVEAPRLLTEWTEELPGRGNAPEPADPAAFDITPRKEGEEA